MVWNEINNEQELNDFLEFYGGFHDSCLKELRYISGAYVNEEMAMNPINDKRKLHIVFQRQHENPTAIEMEFSGLLKLSLCPEDESYTCEIHDVSMFIDDGKIYWGDSNWFEVQRDRYESTWLCAEKVRWRVADEYMGGKEIYC